MPGKPNREAGKQFAVLPLKDELGLTLVLLVTSRETRRWVLPKGWAEKQLSGPELAAKEAFEEAGVTGQVQLEPAGSYSYHKHLADGRTVMCTVEVFPMRVDRLPVDWPERQERTRQWFTLPEAASLVQEAELGSLLLQYVAL
ncbi:NUDIX hydrolase [Muricoccus pecuniae]|uniref:8-oxo-dGTP pyrophosphatase MutT (NUDIX family) n=1 Tax=Muricoccus pecuniae TaxID=693023 RepID=A0A840Y9J6_9PROT|nr:NUDIX hydrolase [Roseomonas pecuniae]MBB5696600.1 8-oxo-dGTP pyrophosphatase MutT (NUDIX family) [Roseomonas pecuniae]